MRMRGSAIDLAMDPFLVPGVECSIMLRECLLVTECVLNSTG